MGGVTITELIDKMGLRNMTPELETDNVMLVHADVNRPALQLTGFFDHFDKDRVQIIGYVENAYISTLTPQRRREMFDKLLSSGIPCLVYSRGMAPEEERGTDTAGSSRAGNTYTFTQNNYSPKALSRLDIYRQTKNQFSALKGAVSRA